MFCWWDFTHSEPLRCWDFSQSESVLSLTGFFPTRRTVSRCSTEWISPTRTIPLLGFSLLGVSFHWWDFSHLNVCLCTLCWWDFSHLETATQIYLRDPSRLAYGNRNPQLWDFPHLKFLLCCKDFPHLELLFDVPLMRFFLLENTNTNLGLPWFNQWAEEPPGSFSLSGPSRVATALLGFSYWE